MKLPALILVLLAAAALAQNRPPRSDSSPGTSSSKQTKIDLSPPPGEHGVAPGRENDDRNELTPWDPHKAAKDVEVGEYYYKQKNYKAAISRFREALYWKPRDAVATFKLAQALEKSGELDEARTNYEDYLKILPDGEYAAQARKALERLAAPPPSSTRK
ncbi:MAG: tol-pal system YbgF family protein [Terriglobales bacterium]